MWREVALLFVGCNGGCFGNRCLKSGASAKHLIGVGRNEAPLPVAPVIIVPPGTPPTLASSVAGASAVSTRSSTRSSRDARPTARHVTPRTTSRRAPSRRRRTNSPQVQQLQLQQQQRQQRQAAGNPLEGLTVQGSARQRGHGPGATPHISAEPPAEDVAGTDAHDSASQHGGRHRHRSRQGSSLYTAAAGGPHHQAAVPWVA